MPAKTPKPRQPSVLGQNILRLRRQRRWSQTRLVTETQKAAVKLGLPAAAGLFSKVDVCRLETGKAHNVGGQKLVIIARALKVNADVLLTPYVVPAAKEMEDMLS